MSVSATFASTKKILSHPTSLSVLGILLLTGVIYWQTWKSLIDIWIRSETFAHGFIVIPISLWVIWQKKELHPYLIPGKPSWMGFAFILANGFLWLLGSLIHALVIQQYALIGILIGGIWFYLGNETSKKLMFPLAFLYFMVPVGEALLPYLMQYTADFTVYLLRKTGLSVYREGMHFSLVSGDWSVVEACSGLRYLLASFTLGTIYAYITYTKTYKRILFVLFSLILPIIANGFRAYMIVMIGHLSGMKLAVGVDHLIYGAVFFALIIFLMFYIGSFWKDPDTAQEIQNKVTQTSHYSIKNNSFLVIILFISIGLWPFFHSKLQTNYQISSDIPDIDLAGSNWQEIKNNPWPWRPKFEKAITESLHYYQHQGNVIGIYRANFGNEEQGGELVNSQNVLLKGDIKNQWHIVKQTSIHIPLPSFTADYSVLKNNQNDEEIISIFKWYEVGNKLTNSPYLAKIYQLIKRLTFDTKPEIYNILFTLSNTQDEKKNINTFKTFLMDLNLRQK